MDGCAGRSSVIDDAEADIPLRVVAVGYPDHFSGYINSNIQLRLDGLIKNDKKRATGKDAEGFDVDKDGIRILDYEDFYDDYKPENESLEFRKNGTGYKLGLPFNKSSEAMVYNATFFDWAKTQNDLKDNIFVPTTWAEVKTVGKAIKALFASKNVYGKILGSDGNVYETLPENVTSVYDATKVASADEFKLLSYDSTANMFITLVRQFGGTYTEIDKTKTGVGYAAFNDASYKQKTLDAMAMVRDLDSEGLIGIPASFGESLYCSTPFKNGRSLLNIGSTAGVSNAVTGGFITKAAAIPQNEKLPNTKFVISQGTNLALFNKGTEAEKVASWKLMVYLSQQIKSQPCKNLHIVFGMVDDKDIDTVMNMLPTNATYYFTQAQTKRAIPANIVKEKGKEHHLKGYVFPQVADAYKAALHHANEDDFIFVGGSSYIVADFLTLYDNMS